MAKCNAQFLQIGLGHVRQDIEIDGILGKHGRVLREPEPIKPSRYLVADTHGHASSRSLYYITTFSLSV
jgi:hypothetical protein